MDSDRFIEQLPMLYHHWGQETIHPKSEQFQNALERMSATTTANVMQLLNWAVACLDPGEIYCEVGCFWDGTLVGALLNQPERMAYAIANFSEVDAVEPLCNPLTETLSQFNLQDQVWVCDQEFEAFFADLRDLQTSDRIGVYVYNGAQDYRSQLMGLLLAKPFWADRALIIVHNRHQGAVQQANWDFIAAHPQAQMLLDLPQPDRKRTGLAGGAFGNGLQVIAWDTTAHQPLPWTMLQAVRQPAVVAAIAQLSSGCGPSELLTPQAGDRSIDLRAELDDRCQTALNLLQSGQWAAAEAVYLAILQQDDRRAAVWHELGMARYLLAHYPAAETAIFKAIALDASVAGYHYSLGLVAEKLAQIEMAAQAYQQAIALDASLIDAHNNLGNLVAQHGDLGQAERIFRTAIALNPQAFGCYLNLGNLLLIQEQLPAAIAAYEAALQINPTDADGLANLALAQTLAQEPLQASEFAAENLYRRQQYAAAASRYQRLLDAGRSTLEIYAALADCYEQLKQYERALEVNQQGREQFPATYELPVQRIRILQEIGQTEAAIVQATQSAAQFPQVWQFQLQKSLLLPPLYQTVAELPIWRDRYQRGLTQVTQADLTAPESQRSAVAALSQFNNFFLICQPENPRAWQQQYGAWVQRVMAANFPVWSQPLGMPPATKIRVGYVSGCFRGHTVGKLMLGWFRHHDRERFEIHSYHIFDQQDALTEEFRQHSDAFHQLPAEVTAIAQQIQADQLQVLVFLEIGMQPIMTQVAALRLAPVQCTTWAHPVTSGLPTIDYFLSSDLMEPVGAAAHYTEQLVRLPNLAIAMAAPEIPAPQTTRSEFGLREDAVVFLACQTLCKYLPSQDAVFAAIAQQVPKAQFVFVARPNAAIAAQFQQRLQRAFAAVGLDSAAACVMLPPQTQTAYWDLNQIADVFLDSFDWSGGHTTLEAIACQLPVVTLPGELMRGRHSYAILTLLGMTETIAATVSDYVNIAVQLGQDPTWRQQLKQQMQAQQANLYEDTTSVAALERFYEQVVHSSRNPTHA